MKNKKSVFTKATTPEGIRKQQAAIKGYYLKRKERQSNAKLSKIKVIKF